MTSRAHFIRAALFLALFLSPLGAPVIGALISGICPVDTTVVADGPFALDVFYCGLNRPIEHAYQGAVMLSFMPLALAGPLLGGPFVVIWWILGLGIGVRWVWHLWRGLMALI
jgi:hypothetical protein